MAKVDWGQIWLGSDFKQMGVGATNCEPDASPPVIGIAIHCGSACQDAYSKKIYCQHIEFKTH
jgi:hypothetical protein